MLDLNDSFIFKMSPGKCNDDLLSVRTGGSRRMRRSVGVAQASIGCQADEFLSVDALEEKDIEIQILKAKVESMQKETPKAKP